MTLAQAQAFGRQALVKISDAPALDAERLLLFCLKQTESSWLHSQAEQKLTPTQEQDYRRLIQERSTGKPLAYILGSQEFYGRDFTVNEHVLIPRPETESLVDEALKVITTLSKQKQHPLIIADIGTGSGCIAITLAVELGVGVIATDISPAALAVAKENAVRHNVADRITFLQGDLLKPLRDIAVDLIVSNPPYVPTAELSVPPKPETAGLAFEPRLALDGGPDGQRYIEQIKASGIPAVIEVTGGKIRTFNIEKAPG